MVRDCAYWGKSVKGIDNDLPFLYAVIFFLGDGKGLMCEPHGLHMDDSTL